MSQKFSFRICARQGDHMTHPMAFDARSMVFKVAEKAGPGATIEAKKRLVERALGYPNGSWRIHAAWYLQAGSWSAQAMRDLQDRFLKWREAEDRRAAQSTEIEKLARARRDREVLEAARAEYRAQLARVERQLAACDNALRLPAEDVDRP